MSQPHQEDLAKIRRAARAVELRLRADRVLAVLPYTLLVVSTLAVLPITLRKVAPEHLSEASARQSLVALGVAGLLVLVAWFFRRLPPEVGTLLLDKHHRLSDRLTSAHAFARLPAAERTALMEVAIEDACAHARALSPRGAAPLHFPWELGLSFAVGLGVAALASLEVPKVVEEAEPPALQALDFSPDDLELFREALKEMQKEGKSPEIQAAIERFNQLVEDIAQRRLDRDEAFRRMEALERELLQGAEADRKAFEEAMRQMGEDLGKSELARNTGKSLAEQDLEKAKKDLEALAKQLRDPKKNKLDKGAIERLRKALEEAGKRRKEALDALNEKRAELREDLLKKKQKPADADAGAEDPEEERLLKKKERELERLDREAEQAARTGRKLDRLDRELAQAAEDLMRDLALSAEDLEQAAEDINRLQEEAMTDQQKEELRKRLEEMRELLRQQGAGGRERMSRMMRFGKRARGGQQGEGQQGQGKQGQQGQPGQEGAEGQEGQQGQQGQGQGQGDGQEWTLGPNGERILVLRQGQGEGEGQGQGAGQQPGAEGAQPGGEGTQPGGKEAGHGHDPNLQGARTDPKLGTQDVEAQGLDTGQGPSRSEVILSAAERGFRGGGYKRVYTDYRTVAEDELDKETVPDGYRFYVRRYFQLIRPRE